MKNLIVLLCCLFSINLIFAQSQNSSTSVSLSDGEEDFSIEANYSTPLPSTVKTKIEQHLGKANMAIKPLSWEKEVQGDLAYKFEIGPQYCSIFLDKNLLSKSEYNDLFDLSSEVLDLLQADRKRRHPKTPKPPKTPRTDRSKSKNSTTTTTTTTTTNSTDREVGTNDGSRKGSTSVSVSNHDESYRLKASFNTKDYQPINSKIAAAISEQATKKSAKQTIWKKEIDGETAYLISLKKKTCRIFIDKNLVTGKKYRDLVELAEAIAQQVQFD
ncbi:MAG: hypothetical protein AB8G15_20980 [Saprospiraceae bacterium]